MLNTAYHKVGTVYHAPISDLDSGLRVCFGRFGTHLNFIIIVKVLFFVGTVLRFHIWQDKCKMGIAVIVTVDSSLNGSRSKQIKISVPSDQEVNILFLRYQVMQELVKALFYLRSTLYVSMPEKADSVDVHNLIPQYNTIYIVALNMYIVKRYNQDRILLRGDVMDGSKSVITIKEYGKISIHLKEIMDSKGITRNYLARISNTRFEVINKWYNGVVEKMDLDILARICYVLECSPADIIKYDKQ